MFHGLSVRRPRGSQQAIGTMLRYSPVLLAGLGAAAPAPATITIYCAGELKVTQVRGDSNYIQTRLTEVRRESSDVAYRLTAKLREDMLVVKWYTDVWLRTNSPSLPQIRVPLTVEVESA